MQISLIFAFVATCQSLSSGYMVLILNGTSEHVACAWRFIGIFGEKNRFVTALDLIKCIEQIKHPILVLTYAPIFELPSYIITMLRPQRTTYLNVNNRKHKLDYREVTACVGLR